MISFRNLLNYFLICAFSTPKQNKITLCYATKLKPLEQLLQLDKQG